MSVVLPADWLDRIAAVPGSARADQLARSLPAPGGSDRESAVLVLFGEGDRGPDVLLTERAHDLRSHPGQVSFPGGRVDPGDASAEAAALREAWEETGLDPQGVRVLGTLPQLYLMPSDFLVTPVVAHWVRPSPVTVVDPAEVASVVRAPLADLLDPDRRFRARHPSGYVGPAFRVEGLYVWGFTALLLSSLLALAGLEEPWDTSRVEDLPAAILDRLG